MNPRANDFIKILENLSPSKHRHEVFSDWLTLSAAALYTWKNDKAVEEEYLHIAKNYTPEELAKHSQLLAITVEALEEMEGDFLGEVFTNAELTNSRSGQFFTPYHVSYLMAEVSMAEKEFPQDRICRINDPCCGAGGMLIAGAMVMKNRGFNYQQNALFIGQDIDARCARMAFIQLSLLAMPALIICGNTLTGASYWQRETFGCYLSGMEFRLNIEAIKKLATDKPVPEIAEEKPELTKPVEIELVSSPNKELVQGELF
jgi:type I restriction-modification system DNA methylase subunit